MPTAYRVDGSTTLVQTVDPAPDTAYPVVADPVLTFGTGVYLNLNGIQLEAAEAVAKAGVVIGCAGLAKLPFVLSEIIAVVCLAGSAVVPSISSIISDIKHPPASVNPSFCYQAKIVGPGAGGTWKPVNPSNCGAAITKPSPTCYKAQVQNIGWQSQVCNGTVAGTVGQSLRMEALTVADNDGLCAQAHVQNIGWQGEQCGVNVTVGTTGQSLRMESLRLWFQTNHCAQAQVQNIGWQKPVCGTDITVGTTGQSLRIEALKIWNQ